MKYVLLKQVVPVPYKYFSDRGYELVREADSLAALVPSEPRRAKK